MNIKIVRPFLPSIDDIKERFSEALSTGMVTNNSKNVREFESRLHTFLGSELEPLTFCNGEMALYSLIQAVKAKMGYEHSDSFDVIVPSFTFSGTINAIVLNNLRPVFCDVDESLTLDIDKCDYTGAKMIVAVGAYGNLPNLENIARLAEERGMHVIFDSAPAFASRFDGKYVCNHGFSEIYSFHASKIFNTMEGGLAVTSDPEIRELLLRIRDFGQYEKTRGNVSIPGLNSKMSEICAIVGISNLEKIGYILESRKKNIGRYLEFFGKLEISGHLKTMKVDDRVDCNYLYFPIILQEDATEFAKFMQDEGIYVRRYYTAVSNLDYYKGRFEEMDLSYTNEIKDRIVSIPIHTEMEDSEIDMLFETIKKYFNI